MDDNREPELRRLRRLSHWLDELIPLPGGYRIGLDGIIGLIPGAGDTLGAVVASYIIARAARMGVPTPILLRMIYNVALESVVGVIPALGDLFDFAWKANRRNVALLERHIGEASRGERGDRRLWWLLIVLIGAVLLLGILLATGFVWLIVELVSSA